ncbi:MAG: response regulator [Roseiflexaceae bacterium]|nr:response regulator [Roseiflexaceae bacterium]
MALQTILIIDDAAEHRDILSRLLRATGYDVFEVLPGPDALARAMQVQPDLILANLSLPGQPGWETVRQLRTHAPLAHTPVLGTTVFTTLVPRWRVQSIGCTDCVDKPFDFDMVLSRVRGLLPLAA